MDSNLLFIAAHIVASFAKDVAKSYNRARHVEQLQKSINDLIDHFDTTAEVEPASIPLNLEKTATLLVLLHRIILFPYRSRMLSKKITSMIRYRADGVQESICANELEKLRAEAVTLYKDHINDKDDVDFLLGNDVKQLRELLDMLSDLEKLQEVVDDLPEQTTAQAMKLHLLEQIESLKHELYENETKEVLRRLKNLDYLEVCLHYLPDFQKLKYLKNNVCRIIAEEKRERGKIEGLEGVLENVDSLESFKNKYLTDPGMPFMIKDIKALYNLNIEDLDNLMPEYETQSGIHIIKHLVKQRTDCRKQEVILELLNGDVNISLQYSKQPPVEPGETVQAPIETLNLADDNVVVSYSKADEVAVA